MDAGVCNLRGALDGATAEELKGVLLALEGRVVDVGEMHTFSSTAFDLLGTSWRGAALGCSLDYAWGRIEGVDGVGCVDETKKETCSLHSVVEVFFVEVFFALRYPVHCTGTTSRRI